MGRFFIEVDVDESNLRESYAAIGVLLYYERQDHDTRLTIRRSAPAVAVGRGES